VWRLVVRMIVCTPWSLQLEKFVLNISMFHDSWSPSMWWNFLCSVVALCNAIVFKFT
jgi:hypothetical protein